MQTFTPVSVVHDHKTRSAARGDFYVSSANLKYYTNMKKVLDYGTISVDQSNSPQVYLFLKVDIRRTISHSKIYSSF